MPLDEAALDGQFTREVYRAIASVHSKHKLAARTRMLQLIDRYRSARAAWRSMPADEMTTGMVDLAGAGLLYLTVEYHMLKRKYAALFTVDERHEAVRALQGASLEAFHNDRRRMWAEHLDADYLLINDTVHDE